jgi:WhiB family transcriptional regulator, redox-sensing transcriptional regulator
MTVALIADTSDTSDTSVGACTADPERWFSSPDEAAKAICRACPRRWLCARDACETPHAEGMWAGVFVPESGRPRTFALRQLRSLAEHGGYPVRENRRLRAVSREDGDA